MAAARVNYVTDNKENKTIPLLGVEGEIVNVVAAEYAEIDIIVLDNLGFLYRTQPFNILDHESSIATKITVDIMNAALPRFKEIHQCTNMGKDYDDFIFLLLGENGKVYTLSGSGYDTGYDPVDLCLPFNVLSICIDHTKDKFSQTMDILFLTKSGSVYTIMHSRGLKGIIPMYKFILRQDYVVRPSVPQPSFIVPYSTAPPVPFAPGFIFSSGTEALRFVPRGPTEKEEPIHALVDGIDLPILNLNSERLKLSFLPFNSMFDRFCLYSENQMIILQYEFKPEDHRFYVKQFETNFPSDVEKITRTNLHKSSNIVVLCRDKRLYRLEESFDVSGRDLRSYQIMNSKWIEALPFDIVDSGYLEIMNADEVLRQFPVMTDSVMKKIIGKNSDGPMYESYVLFPQCLISVEKEPFLCLTKDGKQGLDLATFNMMKNRVKHIFQLKLDNENDDNNVIVWST